MTAYESLKRKENVLREASLRAEAPDMKSMWFEKSRELRKKINEMTIEEAEKEYKKGGINAIGKRRRRWKKNKQKS